MPRLLACRIVAMTSRYGRGDVAREAHNHADFLRHEGNCFIQRESVGICQCPCHYIGMAHDYHLSANAKTDFLLRIRVQLVVDISGQDYYVHI